MADAEGGSVTTVVQQDQRVLVSVPMVGFPPGFQLHPNDRVVLVSEPTGPVVRPLVRSIVVDDLVQDIVQRGSVEIEGQTLALQPEIAVSASPPGTEITRGCVVFVVESSVAEEPPRVVGIRSSAERGE